MMTPNSAYFRLAKRAYVVIDTQGIVRYQEVMDDPGHVLDAEAISASSSNRPPVDGDRKRQASDHG